MVQDQGKRPVRQLSPEKAIAILSGAMQEFLGHGYAGTSMDRVASAAGVSKATVYSHFQDKEGLFAALIKRMAAEKLALFDDNHAFEGTAREVLERVLRQGLAQIREDEQYLTFIRLIIGESGRFPRLAKLFVSNLSKQGIDRLTRLFENHPQFDFEDPEAIARIVIGSIVHYKLMQDILHGQEIVPFDVDRIVSSLLDLICGPAENKSADSH